MSVFYHEVRVGFNYWYLAVPLAVLLMGAVGTFRYYRTADEKIRKRGAIFFYVTRALACVAATLLTILVVIESIAGIFQLCLNVLTISDDSAWAIFVLAGALICLFVTLIAAMFGGLRVGEMYSLGVLIEARHLANKRVLRPEENDDDDDDDGEILLLEDELVPEKEPLKQEGPVIPDFMFRGLRERNY